MKRSELFFELPPELVAQQPLKDRAQARLMVVDRAAGTISHDSFPHIGKYLPPRSVLVVNDSKVIPARLWGTKQRSGGKVEIFLLRRLKDTRTFEVLLRPMGKVRTGDVINFPGSRVTATIEDRENRVVVFSCRNVLPHLKKIGHVPLPPYIRRPDTADDQEYYQTVYARHAGSVASPTAGLHFTRPLLAALKKRGHELCSVTLHVNQGTFKPIEAENVLEHRMHSEEYAMTAAALRTVRKAEREGRKVVAVGTTSCRVLESVARTGTMRGSTDIFITPGYAFRSVDSLITNFHLPHSTLLALVYAFGSPDLMRKAYAEAIREKYRFYSYGDAMIIR